MQDRRQIRADPLEGDVLLPVSEIGFKPGIHCTSKANEFRETCKKNGVGDCIEGCREVKEYQDADMARVSCHVKVICDFDEGSFCAVMCPETRLKRLVEIVL